MTSRPLFLVFILRIVPGLLLLLAAGCSTPGTVSRPTASTVAKAEGAFDDDAHALTPIEAMVTAAGKDPAKLATVERDLLATMQKSGAAPALVQEAAQHLGYVMQAGSAAPATLAALAPMLENPAMVDFARLALDRVPGKSVDELYLAALPGSTGRVRLALINSAAARSLTAAVPLLVPGLTDADSTVALATAQAMGRIGGPAALAALESSQDSLAPAVLNARLAAAAKIDSATTARTAGSIYHNSAAPLPQRSAALRQLIEANSAGTVTEIHTALSGTEPAFQAVAIQAVSTLAVPGSPKELANRLDSYAPAVEVPLIAALGARGDAGAVPGLFKALNGTDAAVRLAAIEALGRLTGTADTARRLALLATGDGPEAKAAFASLTRLNGPGIDDFVQAGAGSGDALLQPVFIQQLAARNQTEAIPFLLSLRGSPVEALRLEALDALRAIAATNDEPAIIAWALGAKSPAEQTRAVRALITIILRDGAVATRADTLIAAIKADDAPARLVLLPALSRVAGPGALSWVGVLSLDKNEAVATAATAELARWPDATALPVLVFAAVSTPVESVRTTAVQGAARFLARNSDQPSAERSAQARKLLGLSIALPEKLALLNVLSLCADQPALAAARANLADPATAEAARDAVDAIASNLAGPPTVTADATPADAALMADGKADTFWQVPNETGTWIRADLHSARPVRKITLDHGGRGWGYPGKLDVQVSDNPDQPGAVVTQGEGERNKTLITLPAGTRGRYVWLRLADKRDAPLAIAELTVE